jgi:signal transduction histidine kinase
MRMREAMGGADADAVAGHFAVRRDALLERWREAADADPQLATASALSRAQFLDHIPEVLEAFEQRLRARDVAARADAAADERDGAAGHGRHRWQQGYQQREVMREWHHLQLVLVDELERFTAARPDTDPAALARARRALAELCGEGVCESADQYANLQRAEAAARVRDLERAFAELDALGTRRAEAWREAAHDLRGTLGVVKNATAVLNHDAAPPDTRAQSLARLQRAVGSMHALLNDLIDLARLEAGHERRTVEPFDVARVLTELCDAMRPLAEERGLALAATGPDTLPVEGDSVKTYRIAQNLITNAVKYTERGRIAVTWEADPEEPAARWVLVVQDTGPGLKSAAAAPLARALKAVTEDAQAVGEQAAASGEPSVEAEPPPLLASESAARAVHEASGEGIGLAIVKRLCELLDAQIELHTEPGKGTTFRVIFPRREPGALPAGRRG